jgi:hypothetical protein
MQKAETKDYFVIRRYLFDQLIENIQVYYALRGVSNMYLAKVLDKLSQGDVFATIEQQEILQLLFYIVRNVAGWATIVDNKYGTILRISKEVSMSSIKEQLDRSFASNNSDSVTQI